MTEQVIHHLVIDESQRVSDWNLCVGLGETTEITSYRESDNSIWFNVYVGDQVTRRINGKFVVEVGYTEKE